MCVQSSTARSRQSASMNATLGTSRVFFFFFSPLRTDSTKCSHLSRFQVALTTRHVNAARLQSFCTTSLWTLFFFFDFLFWGFKKKKTKRTWTRKFYRLLKMSPGRRSTSTSTCRLLAGSPPPPLLLRLLPLLVLLQAAAPAAALITGESPHLGLRLRA